MKRYFIITLLFYADFSLAQNPILGKDSCDTFLYFLKSKEQLLQYIDNPCPNDTSCLKDIVKAKSEVAKGRITFCMPKSLLVFELRQENQLRQLCDTHGINFEYELFSDVGIRGQTQGCYGLYMDKIIAQKFGDIFKSNLLRQADTLLVASGQTVYYTLCDSLPTLPDREVGQSTEMNVPIDGQLFKKLKASKNGYYPQVDIGFDIDSIGTPSKYFLSQFIIYDDIKENERFKNKLCKIAFDFIEQFKVWKPGIILNKKVNTEYNTRISFVDDNRH